MPGLRKPRPLWELQVMLGCAIIAPLVLFGLYTGIRITDAQLRNVREDLAIEARTLSAGVDRVFIGEIERLQALAASPSLRQGDFAEFMFGITVPVEIDGESRYVVGRSQDQHSLARLVAANEVPPGRLAVIADAAHHIIARSEQEDAFIGKELPPAQWHHAGPGGVFEFIDSEGRLSLEASARSELTGWQTAVWAPKALLE